MAKEKRLERKPLSFSTTMRNPERIAVFLESLVEFEGETLTNELVKKVIKKWIVNKLIRPDTVFKSNVDLKNIFYNQNEYFSNEQAEFIYNETERLTKGHKDAGFDKGWPTRFNTYMLLPMEFGFIYYKMNKKIEISDTGKLLIKANDVQKNESAETGEELIKVSDIFLNALVKYQTNNPFRRNLIENAPFVLYLETVQKLKNDFNATKTGIYRHEIPFVTCWPDNDSNALAKYIAEFRDENGKSVSDEVVYEKCLELLKSDNEVRFKFAQITKEGVDDFIRKLRITGLASLRGGGRLIDINKYEVDRANYVIQHYNEYQEYTDEYEYYRYMGSIDNKLIEIHTAISEVEIVDIRQKNLAKWSKEMTTKDIVKEFKSLTSKNGSSHKELKFISAPTRFEFLMSIALKHKYPSLDIKPNYAIDDEGMPTFTASGGKGDIEVYGINEDVLVEVTMMMNKQQSTNEIPGITRHMREFKENKDRLVFSIFVAPSIHNDTEYMIGYTKTRYDIDIYAFTIDSFISVWKDSKDIKELQV